jgi:hypothetical protein
MQIASSDERITINSARLADLNEYMLINSVPYLKENNSPIPFNVISLHTSNSVNAYGFKGCNLYNKYSDRISSSRASGRCNYSSVIVDNVNPNMIHCFDLTGGTLNAQKLIINEDKTISLLSKNTIASYTTDSVIYDVPFPSYITQDNDYIYALISLGKTKTDISAGATSSTGYTNGGTTSFSTLPYVYKIRKNDYSASYVSLWKTSKAGGGKYNVTTSKTYWWHQISYSQATVLYEVPNEGLVIYVKEYSTTNGSYSSETTSEFQQLHTSMIYYTFNDNKITYITMSDVKPYAIDYNGASSSIVNAEMNQIIAYPSQYLETDNSVYGYVVDATTHTSGYAWDMFYMEQSKEDLLNVSFTKLEMIFPEELSEIATCLPTINLTRNAYSNTSSATSSPSLSSALVNSVYGYTFETFNTNFNGIDYVHVMHKGDIASPVSTRGIYTFKINEDKTTATFVSFYPALGGSFVEHMVLKEDRSRIAIFTSTSYHILNFDTVSESWVSAYDCLTRIDNVIHTKEDKLYLTTQDYRIICQDLSGAIMIDFNFEKPVYNYNNADINSYITIWAKNVDEEYTATNIKLTLLGNVVWQGNGLQTLETTTSAEGPINIPFIIKGHTAINVSVDAII